MNDAAVRAAVKAANADYPEAAEAIDAGGPAFLDVRYSTSANGWNVTVVAAYAVPVDGGVALGEPALLADGQRFPRWATKSGGAEKFCQWLVSKNYPDNEVPVVVRRAG